MKEKGYVILTASGRFDNNAIIYEDIESAIVAAKGTVFSSNRDVWIFEIKPVKKLKRSDEVIIENI